VLGSWLILTCSCRTSFEFSCQVTTECTSIGRQVLPTNTESNRISWEKMLLYTGTTRLNNSYFPEGRMQVEFCASWNRVHCASTQLAIRLNSNSNTFENDRQQYGGPAVCTITQMYPSATFVSLRFLSRHEIFGAT